MVHSCREGLTGEEGPGKCWLVHCVLLGVIEELGLVFWYMCWERGHFNNGWMAKIGLCWG
jgi:hypothetical protein